MIDGDSLNDSATQIGGMTGENGSKIINVTRPDAHGTKVAITAALYNNASATASIDTILPWSPARQRQSQNVGPYAGNDDGGQRRGV